LFKPTTRGRLSPNSDSVDPVCGCVPAWPVNDFTNMALHIETGFITFSKDHVVISNNLSLVIIFSYKQAFIGYNAYMYRKWGFIYSSRIVNLSLTKKKYT